MSGMTETSAGATAIRPFTAAIICDAEPEALRARIMSTRLPRDTGRGPWMAVSGQ